ncbi:MAG TPA: hypothetical protein VH796_13930 [Nitrososphaeraceae archaeon]|jgi:hypothetical protein
MSKNTNKGCLQDIQTTINTTFALTKFIQTGRVLILIFALIVVIVISIQTNTSLAEIITFKNGLSINTSRPFDQEMKKTMNAIGPEKAKEFNTGLSTILFKNEASVNDCITQNTPKSSNLISIFMTKACDLAASLVTQFCQIQIINDQHKDLCNNYLITNYLHQRRLDEKEQNQLAWILFNMGNTYPTNRNNNTIVK